MNQDQKIIAVIVAAIVLFNMAIPLVPIMRCAHDPNPALTVKACAEMYSEGIVR